MFNKMDKTLESSRYAVCKKYIKKYSETNPEALKIAKKKYVEKHKSTIKEYQKDYHTDYYKWRQFLYNTSYKYEKQLFLQILI